MNWTQLVNTIWNLPSAAKQAEKIAELEAQYLSMGKSYADQWELREQQSKLMDEMADALDDAIECIPPDFGRRQAAKDGNYILDFLFYICIILLMHYGIAHPPIEYGHRPAAR